METVITVTCVHCKKDLTLVPEAVHIYLYTTPWPGDYYAFFCTSCKQLCQKSTTDDAVATLIKGGVAKTLIEVPLEVIERKACRIPLTEDDLLNLAGYLRDNDVMPPQGKVPRRSARKQGTP